MWILNKKIIRSQMQACDTKTQFLEGKVQELSQKINDIKEPYYDQIRCTR